MKFQTLSAILRGKWLIDQTWASAHLPMIAQMIQGKEYDFGYKGRNEKAYFDENAGPIDYASIAHKADVNGVGIYTVTPWRTASTINAIPHGSIALVDVVGPVTKYGEACSYGSSDIASVLANIDNSPNIAGVILNVDSPGGQVDGTALLADQVSAMSKPVVAMVNDGMMASAAMWIGSATREIYATKSSDSFGSIGVYATLYDWNGYFKQNGLNVHEIYAPQSTDKNGDYRAALSGDYGPMKADLKQVADNFIQTVLRNRPMSTASVDKWSSGAMFNAKDAKSIGLIDGIKTFDQIIGRLQQLAKSNTTNSNRNMNAEATATPFANTLRASHSESFAVVEGGFLLTEDQLNAIETKIGTNATQYQTAIDANTGLTGQLSTEQDAHLVTKEELKTANTEIQRLNAEVSRLNGMTGMVRTTPKEGDNFDASNTEEKYMTSVDRELAERRRSMGK